MLGLGRGSRDYYLNATMFAKHLDAYKKYQREIVKLLLEDANVTFVIAELLKQLDDVIDFETRFAKVSYIKQITIH